VPTLAPGPERNRYAIRAHTMVLVRAVMPVRGVVHGQTASSFGWKGLKP
jgi:hypothetical protein